MSDPRSGAAGFDAGALRTALGDVLPLLDELVVAASVDSTNSEALRRLDRRVPAPEAGLSLVACVADAQTAGRGRRGRQWLSPPGDNLYLSLAWRQPAGAHGGDPAGLPLALGASLAEVLEGLGCAGVGLKWPNDLHVAGAKLGGVLLESRLGPDGMRLVAGIGINHRVSPALASAVGQPVTFLDAHAPGIERIALAAAVLRAAVTTVRRYHDAGLDAFRAAWSARDQLRDRAVCVLGHGADLVGVARGINAAGELLIETGDGVETCRSGEVSVRAVAP